MPPKYKPGGKRFPPRVTSKPLPKQVVNSVSDASPSPPARAQTSSGLDEEAENRFELELCWCIQQLEISGSGKKMSEKQMMNTAKTLNLLKSDTVALITKRQIMANTFGDYRSKMKEDEKKYGKAVSKVAFSAPKSKSVFLKKAAAGSNEQDTVHKESSNGTADSDESASKKPFVMSKQPSEVPFTFNFSNPESE